MTGKTFPAFPAHAYHNFAYLARGPCRRKPEECHYNDSYCDVTRLKLLPTRLSVQQADQTNTKMKGQSEIANLPKFVDVMLIVMVIKITEIL